MSIGSLEDSVIAKLKLNELQMPEKIAALVDYFNSVITEKVKTNPVELKAVLNLMNSYKDQDKTKSILGYINSHQTSIDYFFSNNMQRFDRFEFKPYFLRIKDIEPGKEFAVPIHARRNFETFRPMDTKLAKNILEQNPEKTTRLKENVTKIDARAVDAQRIVESKKITAAINELQQKITQNIQSGTTTKEAVLEKVKFVEELFIPELQFRYNEPALQGLAEMLFAGAQREKVDEVFNSLKMPHKQRELFCEALAKKL